MVAGTFILTDSIDNAFNSIFTEVSRRLQRRRQRQVRVRPRATAGTTTPPIDESLLAQVRALPGVAEAEAASTARPS